MCRQSMQIWWIEPSVLCTANNLKIVVRKLSMGTEVSPIVGVEFSLVDGFGFGR